MCVPFAVVFPYLTFVIQLISVACDGKGLPRISLELHNGNLDLVASVFVPNQSLIQTLSDCNYQARYSTHCIYFILELIQKNIWPEAFMFSQSNVKSHQVWYTLSILQWISQSGS